MKLKSLNYWQHENTPEEWRLKGLSLGQINLIVGKNSSGKTRSIAVIQNLGKLLCGEIKASFRSGNWDAYFEDKGQEIRYQCHITDSKVVYEELSRGQSTLLKRGVGGKGLVYTSQIKKDIEFQAPDNEIAAAIRRDPIQHPFLEPLNEWGKQLHSYPFGTALGRDTLGLIAKDAAGAKPADARNPQMVVATYRNGEKDLGASFKEGIKADMGAIGYALDDIGVAAPSGLSIVDENKLPGDLIALWVKETSLAAPTSQMEMSQGMFRALAVIIQLNYSAKALKPSCILIDDIGEGLDFERACALIELITRKATDNSVQLIMATNDRFIMNKVPLEAWSVLHRDGQECRVFNYSNAKKRFDEFKFTGLSNFDFFSTDFVTSSTDS